MVLHLEHAKACMCTYMQTQTDPHTCFQIKQHTNVQFLIWVLGAGTRCEHKDTAMSTFSHRASTVPAWITATCSSFLKFYNTKMGKGIDTGFRVYGKQRQAPLGCTPTISPHSTTGVSHLRQRTPVPLGGDSS